jgi:hypothetical protein
VRRGRCNGGRVSSRLRRDEGAQARASQSHPPLRQRMESLLKCETVCVCLRRVEVDLTL